MNKEQIRQLGQLESRLNWVIDDLENQTIIRTICNTYTIEKVDKFHIYGKYTFWRIDGFQQQFDSLLSAILFCEGKK